MPDVIVLSAIPLGGHVLAFAIPDDVKQIAVGPVFQ
jgi:hypothetical protein